MHTIPEILASGIPMRYDSAGVKQSFESAGMIEIKGIQNGKEIKLKQNKKIEINMASQKKGDRFNLYYLDTIAKQWQCLGKEKLIEGNQKLNQTKDNLQQATSAIKNDIVNQQLKTIDLKIAELQTKENKNMEYMFDKDNINNIFPLRKSFYVDENEFINTINSFSAIGKAEERRKLFNDIIDKNSKTLIEFLNQLR